MSQTLFQTIVNLILILLLQEGLQFLETSHNEIVYKTKKVEYILEKERRARRGSQPTNEMTKMAKFKLWVTSKVIQDPDLNISFL